ncbi:hypothetical protein JD969_05725 [Planctomycetota bacterium]|nr:hypothetical protein JD969_05725 [Planctomycetota bacterium]
MKHLSISIIVVAFVFMITSLTTAQWTSSSHKTVRFDDEPLINNEPLITGRLEYLIMEDGDKYRSGDFDGAKHVSVYQNCVVVRKGSGRSAAVIVPFDNLKYLVLD